jgi:hypothetical protein
MTDDLRSPETGLQADTPGTVDQASNAAPSAARPGGQWQVWATVFTLLVVTLILVW